MKRFNSVIIGTGSHIPTQIIPNTYFSNYSFYDQNGKIIDQSNEEIISKFNAITDIEERRYVESNQTASDIAYLAALEAIENAKIDKETLDYIIFAHNFGDIVEGSNRISAVPSLASKVKEKLKIVSHKTVAYDILFGCPGWVQGMIQADYYIRSGDAKRILVIGAETISRIVDPHDRDTMIYADGAGATILEAVESEEKIGIIAHSTRTDTYEHAYNLWLDKSYNAEHEQSNYYLKMHGRKLYEYAISTVPLVVQDSLDKAEIHYSEVKKILIHQANAKLDDAILSRFFRLHKDKNIPEGIMPMTIKELGNSSVATIPTLLDLILKNKMPEHQLIAGDIIIFASVGAGMNINSVVYKVPYK